MAFDWTCPHCQKAQVVDDGSFHKYGASLNVGETRHGELVLFYTAIRCANSACNELTLQCTLAPGQWSPSSSGRSHYARTGQPVDEWMLRPRSGARPYPAFIPEALRSDYAEACTIRDLSPKASATLSRRVLQGMLHDFCGINERTLWHEIEKLDQMLDAGVAPRGVAEETVSAIHAVRKVGNIGAHMQADINVIVDVDPNEAQALIELVELLFEDWYVARHEREQRLARVVRIAADKATPPADEPKSVQAAENPNDN